MSNTFQSYLNQIGEIGFVDEANESLAYVDGLPGLTPNELVVFETGQIGLAKYLFEDRSEILVFAKEPIDISTRVVRTNTQLEIPVGEGYLGKLIDPFGEPLDKLSSFKEPQEKRRIYSSIPGISSRQKIEQSFETGVSLVDMLIPLGKGQRELIIGDRKTGKTNFLLQTIQNQAKKGMICIYAAIGKKKHDVKIAEDYFRENKVMDNVIIMAAFVDSPASTIFISPFSAMTTAEYFRDIGRDVLLVLDDLNTHAKFYREISLLGRRFPGKNAYPADIFYTHASLLERAGNFRLEKSDNRHETSGQSPKAKGQPLAATDQQLKDNVSITCLPVAETVQGDITGFIQTNIMSMTDGHIYFDTDLFGKGRRPAINHSISVTRVGRQTQTKLRRSLNRELTSFLTLLERIENFAHFGAETSSTIKNTLATGDKIIAFFDQTSEIILDENLQTFLFTLLWFGVWRGKSIEQMKADMAKIMTHYSSTKAYQEEIAKLIAASESLNELLTRLGPVYQNLLKSAGITVAPTPAPASQTQINQAATAVVQQPQTSNQATQIPPQNISKIKTVDQKNPPNVKETDNKNRQK